MSELKDSLLQYSDISEYITICEVIDRSQVMSQEKWGFLEILKLLLTVRKKELKRLKELELKEVTPLDDLKGLEKVKRLNKLKKLKELPLIMDVNFSILPNLSTTTPFLESFSKMSDDSKELVKKDSFIYIEKMRDCSGLTIIIKGALDRAYKYSSEFKQFVKVMDDIILQWASQYQARPLAPEYLFDYHTSYDDFLAFLDILGLEHPSSEYQDFFKDS